MGVERAFLPLGASASPEGGFPGRARDVRAGWFGFEVVVIEGARVRVRNLEALDGTPIVDVKPLLGPIDER